MARSPRDRFEAERDRCRAIDDPDVADALGYQMADALDPEVVHAEVPTVNGNAPESFSTGKNYLSALRCAHQRGLDLFEADASTVNRFMQDLVTEPEHRRYDLVEYEGSIGKTTASTWESALLAFYRYCTEPGAADDRPDVAVEWPADAIDVPTERSAPKHDQDDKPEQADLDAIREACLAGQNTRRDRAFIELAAGTGQRVYALVTLRVGDVYLDDEVPHIMLNPEIKNDGDKGAIKNTGRFKPIVTDPAPIRQWIRNHPLRDPEVRAEHGAPDDFDDCYLFVGSLRQRSTDASSHWGAEGARNMLDRRKADTASMPGVKTVDIPVNPHNWRHYAYTKSKQLPIDESVRRRVFGWKRGSDTGERLYDGDETERAGRQYAAEWADAFGESDAEGVAEQVVGAAVAGDISPEVRQALAQDLMSDDALMADLAKRLASAMD